MSVNVTFTVPLVDLDPVDEPELDEVEPELGIDHVAERLEDVFFVDHPPECTDLFVVPCTNRGGMY